MWIAPGYARPCSLPLIDPAAPKLELRALEVTRPGCPAADDCPLVNASGSYTQGRVIAHVAAEHVHLERLGPLFGQQLPIYGKVALNLDVDSAPGADSALELHGQDISFLGYGHGEVDTRVTLSNSELKGQLHATNSLGVTLTADATASLRGNPTELETWRAVTGSAAIRGAVDQLATVQPLLQQRWLESISGQAEFLITLARANPQDRPAVAAELKIHSLDVSAKPNPDVEAIVLEQHGLYANATFDADSNVVYGSALLQDAAGPLLRIKNATVPLPISSESARSSRPALLINASLESRDAAQLPYLNRTPLQGSLGAELTLYGTLEQPEAKLLVVGSKLSMPGLDPTLPVDLSGNVHYRFASHEVAVDDRRGNRSQDRAHCHARRHLRAGFSYSGNARVARRLAVAARICRE